MINKLKSKTSVILLAAIAVVFLGIIAVVICGTILGMKEMPAPQAGERTEKQDSSGKGIKIIEVEREVSFDMIEEGVRGMGSLVTQEYYFTEAVSQSKVKTLFSIPLGFTETSYVATYDGSVTAGIDLSLVSIELGEQEGTVTIRMPKAEIQNVDIDPGSFVLYSEKNGIGNPLSVSDFNGSLIELENRVRDRAIERGLLDQADENAKLIVENFIGSLIDLSKYDLVWETE